MSRGFVYSLVMRYLIYYIVGATRYGNRHYVGETEVARGQTDHEALEKRYNQHRAGCYKEQGRYEEKRKKGTRNKEERNKEERNKEERRKEEGKRKQSKKETKTFAFLFPLIPFSFFRFSLFSFFSFWSRVQKT